MIKDTNNEYFYSNRSNLLNLVNHFNNCGNLQKADSDKTVPHARSSNTAPDLAILK